MKKRTVALLMAVVMLFGAAVGGTIAWLTADSNEVNNTFTVGDINITLDETDIENPTGPRNTENEYKMVPGKKYMKDPIVHVEAGSEPCYVFVRLTEKNNAYGNDKVIQYTINSDWTLVTTEANGDKIYVYGTLAAPTVVNALNLTAPATADTTSVFAITEGTTITVNPAVTKAELTAMEDGTKPTLDFIAYAIQADNLTVTAAADIWNLF
ncbi:MAG: hypothetical protein II977_08105 [Oscillospiraceae bacterium]|nr:hypothetical protein [Oscillospiraceae bacterium]